MSLVKYSLFVRNSITYAVLFFILGCTDSIPQVSFLKNLNALEFASSQVVASSLGAVPLEATCSEYVDFVEVSFDSGVSWMDPSAHDSAASPKCVQGKFKMNLLGASPPLNSMTVQSGSTLKLKFRAKMRTGGWSYRDLDLKYVPSASVSQEVLVGAQIQSGSGFVLRGRVRAQKQQKASGGDYQLQGRIVQ